MSGVALLFLINAAVLTEGANVDIKVLFLKVNTFCDDLQNGKSVQNANK